MAQPLLDPILPRTACGSHGATLIKGLLAIREAADREIDQAVGRSAVPALHRLHPIGSAAGRDERQVGNASKIRQSTPTGDSPDQCGIGAWNQRRSLTAKGEVRRTKIMDDRAFQQLGKQGCLKALPATG